MDTRIDRSGCPGITISGGDKGGKTRFVRSLSQYGSGAVYGVHNSSLANLVRGVAERVLYTVSDGVLETPRKPLANVFERLAVVKSKLLSKLSPTTVVPRDGYAALYHGRKQQVYSRAAESLVLKPIRRSDAYVSTFVKAEKINFSAKGDPAPRVIQPRSPRYNLEVGRYLKLFEAELVHGFASAFGYNVVLKGLNADQVAEQLRRNWDSFHRPVAVGLDASRFDQHVSQAALAFEHSVYNAVFHSKELRKLLSWQLVNHGFGRVGDSLVKYVVEGCRMSGDINTGMGNCLIMSSIVLGYLEQHGVQARLSNNGDDCVLILEHRDLHKLDGIDQWFTDFGFKLTREPTVDVFERIEFCQSQPVLLSNGWRMVRNPWTAMSKDCVSLLSWDNEKSFDAWRDAIGTCGYELTRGVPVWESFYTAIRKHGVAATGGAVEHVYDSGLGYMARGVKQSCIDARARYSFWLAFGINPDLQVEIEHQWPDIEYDSDAPLVDIYQIQASNTNPLCLISRSKTSVARP